MIVVIQLNKDTVILNLQEQIKNKISAYETLNLSERVKRGIAAKKAREALANKAKI